MTSEILRLQLSYTTWASQRLVKAAAELTPEDLRRDFGTADKSVLGTLVHVKAADRIWLARVLGEPPAAFTTEEDFQLAALENLWPPVQNGWSKWSVSVDDDQVRNILRYKDTKGREWTQPLWQIVLHVVNHATHHRGQVSGFLRAMGVRPPSLDLTTYYRE